MVLAARPDLPQLKSALSRQRGERREGGERHRTIAVVALRRISLPDVTRTFKPSSVCNSGTPSGWLHLASAKRYGTGPGIVAGVVWKTAPKSSK